MRGMADLVRYVPGVGIAQGEGNRDTPVLRGNSSTSDFFEDGIRDDVQYFRDLYNVERVEVLKGPNAMTFGRGGVGGVINRVPRKADGSRTREITVQGGSWNERRATTDVGNRFGRLDARVTAVYENSDSYRDGRRPRALRGQPDLRLSRWRPARRCARVTSTSTTTARRTAAIPSFAGTAAARRPRDLLRERRPQLRDGHAGRLLGHPRAQDGAGEHAQPHPLRGVRQVLPERVSGRGERGRHRRSRSRRTTTPPTAGTSSTRPTSCSRPRTGSLAHTLLVGGELGRQDDATTSATPATSPASGRTSPR